MDVVVRVLQLYLLKITIILFLSLNHFLEAGFPWVAGGGWLVAGGWWLRSTYSYRSSCALLLVLARVCAATHSMHRCQSTWFCIIGPKGGVCLGKSTTARTTLDGAVGSCFSSLATVATLCHLAIPALVPCPAPRRAAPPRPHRRKPQPPTCPQTRCDRRSECFFTWGAQFPVVLPAPRKPPRSIRRGHQEPAVCIALASPPNPSCSSPEPFHTSPKLEFDE